MEQHFRTGLSRFRHLVSGPVAFTTDEAAAWLDNEVMAGRLAPGDARRVERADLLIRGDRDSSTAYLVVEVSWLVDERDVRRAHDRAALLRKAGYETQAVVAGERIQEDALALAERLGVEHVLEDEADDEA
jgi:hypothetical protein